MSAKMPITIIFQWFKKYSSIKQRLKKKDRYKLFALANARQKFAPAVIMR